jgi:hypothetical protein
VKISTAGMITDSTAKRRVNRILVRSKYITIFNSFVYYFLIILIYFNFSKQWRRTSTS